MWQIAVVGQPEELMWVGNDLRLSVWMLLMIFHSARGFDEEDWTSAAWTDFLAAAINLW